MPRFLLAAALSLGLAMTAAAQREFGFDNRKPSSQEYLKPDESLKRMKVAEGFEIHLAAAEPLLVNPIAFTIDEKGRLWVVECFEYPSRTPEGKAPRDRIVILESTKGDGVYDKRTVFAEGKDFPVSRERKKAGLGAFDLASGIEVGHGGVYVGAPPYLWFIENKDDKPGKFETVLSGFGSQDTHETLNTFQWGPDGWLYGLHGVFTQSTVKPLDGPETRMNAAVWRFHPKTKKFEIFAEGTSNPWGMDWRNTDGQFILACCVIPHLYHIVPGGIYQRQSGASYNPYAYGYIKEICDHTFHKESGWAHAGLISLDAPHIPEKYRNSVIFGSIHGCSLKQNILKPNGSSFIATRGDDFLVSGDKNFRPINLKWGPNGDIFLIDWHDQNPCHQARPDSWDYERGRVYRIQVKGRKGGMAEDLGKRTRKELADLACIDEPYSARTALRLLHEHPEKLVPKELLEKASGGSWMADRALGALSVGVQDELEVGEFNKSEVVRAAQVRDVVQAFGRTEKTVLSLKALAENETAPTVRRELASAAIRLADKHDVTELVRVLLKNKDDAKDPLIPHLTWLAYEKVISKKDGANSAARVEKELAFLAKEAPDNIFVRDHIVPKVMRRLVATGQAQDLELCLKFLADVKDTHTREKALDGLVVALAGRTLAPPAAWAELQAELRQDRKLLPMVDRLAVSFRDPKALQRALTLHLQGKSTPERIQGLRDLVQLQHPKAGEIVEQCLLNDRELPVRLEAARQLGAVVDARRAETLIKNWALLPREIHSDVAASLASRKEPAIVLLSAMQKKTVERTVATDNTILKMQAFNDKALNELIEKAWGRTRKTPDELNKLIDKTRDSLYAGTASFAAGKKVFENQCAKCHKFDGQGVEVGPALDGAGRDIEYLLANILDPNRVIGAPYFLRTANTLDGQVIQGVLAEEDDQFVTLKIENAQLKKIKKTDLDGELKVQEKSMMPEGLAAGMTEQNFRDLIRYVMLHPYITEAKVNDKAVSVGVPGRLPVPAGPSVTITAEFTAAAKVSTTLLVASPDVWTAKLDGKPLVRRNDGGFEVFVEEGKHTLTLTRADGKAGHVSVRFLDPDRRLSYPEPR